MRNCRMVGLLVLALAVAGGVWATTQSPPSVVIDVSFSLPDLPFDQLVNAADMIVLGPITRIGTPTWSDPLDSTGERVITTPVGVLVTEVLKGNVEPGELVWFRQLGGRIGDTAVRFGDSTDFVKGEKLVLALYRPEGEMAVMTGGELYAFDGKYVITSDGNARHCWRPGLSTVENLKDQIRAAIVR